MSGRALSHRWFAQEPRRQGRRLRGSMAPAMVHRACIMCDGASNGGILVTTPVRTMLDLATTVHRDPRVLTWMDKLALVSPDVPEEASAMLRRMSRVPGSRAGRAVLDRLAVRKR